MGPELVDVAGVAAVPPKSHCQEVIEPEGVDKSVKVTVAPAGTVVGLA